MRTIACGTDSPGHLPGHSTGSPSSSLPEGTAAYPGGHKWKVASSCHHLLKCSSYLVFPACLQSSEDKNHVLDSDRDGRLEQMGGGD